MGPSRLCGRPERYGPRGRTGSSTNSWCRSRIIAAVPPAGGFSASNKFCSSVSHFPSDADFGGLPDGCCECGTHSRGPVAICSTECFAHVHGCTKQHTGRNDQTDCGTDRDAGTSPNAVCEFRAYANGETERDSNNVAGSE